MSHNREITKLVAESVIELLNASGKNAATEFKTREAFVQFVFSLSIKMVQSVLSCEFRVAYDIVMGDGQFNAMANDIYARLTA